MTIELTKDNDRLTVALVGRLDSTTAGELETVLVREITGSIASLTIDLTQVDFISSKGLRVLVGAYKRMNGREIILSGANQAVLDLLKLSGLLKIFTVR